MDITAPQMKMLENGHLEIYLPFACCRLCGRRRIADEPDKTPLAKAVARAYRWQRVIDSGKYANIKEFARAIGQNPSNVAKILRLTFLAPDIVRRILDGRIPDTLTISALRNPIPDRWSDQRKLFLGEETKPTTARPRPNPVP